MGRLSALLLAFVLGAAAALGLVACGGGEKADLLPGGTASEITANLDKVQELVDAGECVGAEDAAQEVSAQVAALGGVDAKLKQALLEGATRLNEVVVGCEEATTEETEPAIETAVEPVEDEKERKAREKEEEKAAEPEESKPEKEAEEAAEETTPTLPPQAEGKAKGHEGEEAPPVESGGGTPSGGVGPGEEAGGG